MANDDVNILPAYTEWGISSYAHIEGNTLVFENVPSYATATYNLNTTPFTVDDYVRINSNGCTGECYLFISYNDEGKHSNVFDNGVELLYNCSTVLKLPSEPFEYLVYLNEADTSRLSFCILCASTFAEVAPINIRLVEQAVKTVDIEYAMSPSWLTPPSEDAWETVAPQWSSGWYIWQRTATTFVSGRTVYSDPICIQTLERASIYDIIEQYYLSSSSDEPTDGEWLNEPVEWEVDKYIWSRSKLVLSDGSITYTNPVLSLSINEAFERIEEVSTELEEFDGSLDSEGIFNRLTNYGQKQGLYMDDDDIYINATYIRSGRFEVIDSYTHRPIFIADADDGAVNIGPFTIDEYKFYTDAHDELDNAGFGVYLGRDGLSVAYGLEEGHYDNVSIKYGGLYFSVAGEEIARLRGAEFYVDYYGTGVALPTAVLTCEEEFLIASPRFGFLITSGGARYSVNGKDMLSSVVFDVGCKPSDWNSQNVVTAVNFSDKTTTKKTVYTIKSIETQMKTRELNFVHGIFTGYGQYHSDSAYSINTRKCSENWGGFS